VVITSVELLGGLTSILGLFAPSFERLYNPFALQYARRAVFSRAFRISDAVEVIYETLGARVTCEGEHKKRTGVYPGPRA
jgi:hypothetical protein